MEMIDKAIKASKRLLESRGHEVIEENDERTPFQLVSLHHDTLVLVMVHVKPIGEYDPTEGDEVSDEKVTGFLLPFLARHDGLTGKKVRIDSCNLAVMQDGKRAMVRHHIGIEVHE